MMAFLVLAPMYHVTDTVFRQMVVGCAPPDMLVTEFVNVDGLQSRGRDRLLPYLWQEPGPVPLWAQVWGENPDNFYKTARKLAGRAFAGIDLNMGCPDRTVVKNNQCSALIQRKNWPKAAAMIEAVKAGAPKLPVSVKTRLGFKEIDLDWHRFLLEQDLSLLTVHGRTQAEMRRGPANGPKIGQIADLARKIAPQTRIVGNGDLLSRRQALETAEKYGWQGAMIGRAVLNDPFIFAERSPWADLSAKEKVGLYVRHLKLFQATYTKQERPFDHLKKFMRVYLRDFDQASDLRQKISQCRSASEASVVLGDFCAKSESL